jgi:hypothetical protein
MSISVLVPNPVPSCDNKGRIAQRDLQALDTLDYVGLTEDFDASVREVFARIGLPEPEAVVVRNARDAFDDEGAPQIKENCGRILRVGQRAL